VREHLPGDPSNRVCPECRVCGYCLQRRAPGQRCKHPVVRGHCEHYRDLTPSQCRACGDARNRAALARIRENVEDLLDQYVCGGSIDPVLVLELLEPDGRFGELPPCTCSERRGWCVAHGFADDNPQQELFG